MNALTLLYRLRIRVLPRYFTEEDSRRRWQYGSLAVVGVIVFIFVLSFGVGFFGALGTEPSLAAAALSAVFNLTVIICVVTGLASALYTLYLSDDLEVLTATPVQERTILGYKFAETLLTNSPVFVLSALPICIAFAFVVAESAAAAVGVLAVLIVLTPLLLAVPTALCILFSMPLMRLLPASRAKEIVAGLGALVGAGLYVGYLTLIGGPESGQGPEDSRGAASAVAPLLESPASQIPPGSWAAGSLSAVISGETGALTLNLALLAALTAAS